MNDSNVLYIMFDGATDVSLSENEIVYARVFRNGIPQIVLIEIKSVKHAYAEGS